MSTLSVAALQMVSGPDPEANWLVASDLVAQAAKSGATMVVLPENFLVFDAGQYRKIASQSEHWLTRLSQLAKHLGVWLVAGTMPVAERPNGQAVADGRVRTVCHVLNAAGECVGRYDKLHLFDVDVGDAQGRYQESATFEPGDEALTVMTPWGRLGLAICYDLRFPELFRELRAQGADFMAVPAAFTAVTGEAHWQVLLRARAIENQCLIIGAAQGGRHSPVRETYGHAQVIDAWGNVLAEKTEAGPGIVLASFDAQQQAQWRQAMPVWQHRRLPMAP